MNKINCNPKNISNRICADLDLTLARNLNKELECKLQRFKSTLDEIEEIIKGFSCCEWFGNCECCELSDDKNPCLNEILQLIKQAKEGGE